MQIDKNKLRELVSDPKAKTKTVWAGLGFNSDANFYYSLKQDPEAKQIFDSRPGRHAHHGGAQKSSAKQGSKKSSKKSIPRNGNARGAQKELFKKLQHEFEHIDLYGAVSEHFDELRAEIDAAV